MRNVEKEKVVNFPKGNNTPSILFARDEEGTVRYRFANVDLKLVLVAKRVLAKLEDDLLGYKPEDHRHG